VKQTLITILILGFSLLTTIKVASAEPEARSVIGVTIPLSGDLAHIGETIQNSLKLAKEDHDSKDLVEFLIEDNRYQAQTALSSVNKMLLHQNLAGLVSFGGPPSLAVAPITQRRQIPLIAITITENLTEGRDHVFRFFTPVEPQVQALRKEMLKREYKSLAMVTLENEALLVMKNSFEKELPLPLVLNELILPSDYDHRSLALQIRNHNPSAVVLFALPPHHSGLARQLREIGYTGEIVGGPPMESRDELESAMGFLEGAWFSTPDDRGSREFTRRYLEAFGSEPHPHGVLAYDAGKIFIEAVYYNKVMDYLKVGREFSGLFGKYPLGSDRSFLLPVILKEVRENRFVILE